MADELQAALDLAERMGAFGARLDALEKQGVDSARRVDEGFRRLETAMTTAAKVTAPSQDSVQIGALAQAMHRFVDQQQQAPNHSIVEQVASQLMKAKRNDTSPLILVLAGIGIFVIAWMARGFILHIPGT